MKEATVKRKQFQKCLMNNNHNWQEIRKLEFITDTGKVKARIYYCNKCNAYDVLVNQKRV
jgi:hypothetical protein